MERRLLAGESLGPGHFLLNSCEQDSSRGLVNPFAGTSDQSSCETFSLRMLPDGNAVVTKGRELSFHLSLSFFVSFPPFTSALSFR